ncbi:MAG: helix-turn-helix transcriptional regulator [Cyanophyceae cyanobacterium]
MSSRIHKFIDKHQAAEITGLSPHTLKKYRQQGILKEGEDWVRFNSRTVRYNQASLLRWLEDLCLDTRF